ncbi:amidophosphoribosyltransferase [Candidatus Acetothermia bacterium]|nr:amidophosphoribosyltransferase [Candidatus Acetothermia bacterium]
MKLREECGVFGLYSNNRSADISESLYLGLFALQHRGQEAAGFAVSDGRELRCYKNLGHVEHVYEQAHPHLMRGFIGLAHTRYSTQGESARAENAQPMVLRRDGRWLALIHNGNISNARDLRDELLGEGVTFNSTSDTEVLLHLYARAPGNSPAEKLNHLAHQVLGAFSIVLLDGDHLIAARDPFGFRPLVLGQRNGDWIVASETASFEMLGARFVREVDPGEAIVIDANGLHSARFGPERPRRQCIFELIYFCRPDSTLFGHNAYIFRKESGRQLALKETKETDIAIPVPDSGLPAALGYSRTLGLPLELGLIRSHYIGRSFIEPHQASRVQKVKMKLLPLREVLAGKRIAMIDDSIVRGTTSRAIVSVLREFGAKEVHLRVASPPLISPCFFGVDMPTKAELIASSRTLEEIEKFIGADSVVYLSLDELKRCVRESNHFCDACFSGNYPEGSLPEDVRCAIATRASA